MNLQNTLCMCEREWKREKERGTDRACVCLHLCTRMLNEGTDASICACWEKIMGALLCYSPLYSLVAGSLIKSEDRSPRNSTVPSQSALELDMHAARPRFLHWVTGIELRSSCVHTKWSYPLSQLPSSQTQPPPPPPHTTNPLSQVTAQWLLTFTGTYLPYT